MSGTYFIETWGCQMNDLDSQRLSGNLKLRGWRRVDDETKADLENAQRYARRLLSAAPVHSLAHSRRFFF